MAIDLKDTHIELDKTPAKKMRDASDIMHGAEPKGKLVSRDVALAHVTRAPRLNAGRMYRSQPNMTSGKDSTLSGLVPPSRPLDCSEIAVVNIDKPEVDRISCSPPPQQPDGARVRIVDRSETIETPVRGRGFPDFTAQGLKPSLPAYSAAGRRRLTVNLRYPRGYMKVHQDNMTK